MKANVDVLMRDWLMIMSGDEIGEMLEGLPESVLQMINRESGILIPAARRREEAAEQKWWVCPKCKHRSLWTDEAVLKNYVDAGLPECSICGAAMRKVKEN